MSNVPPKASHSTEITNSVANNGAQIQQKLLNYARDFALEKLNKTLDERLAKRRQTNGDADSNIDFNDDDDNGAGSEMAHPTAQRRHRQHQHQRRTTISSTTSSTRRAPPPPLPPPTVAGTMAMMQHQRKKHTHHRRHLHPADDADGNESSTVAGQFHTHGRQHRRQRQPHVVHPSPIVRKAEKGRLHLRHADSTLDADDIDYDTENGARHGVGQLRKGSRQTSPYDNNRNRYATSPTASEFEDSHRRRVRHERLGRPDQHRSHQLVTQVRTSAGWSRLRLHVMQ